MFFVVRLFASNQELTTLHTNTLKPSLLNPKKNRLYVRTCSFHGKSRVFYAQSSSQMIRKQGKPDENMGEQQRRQNAGSTNTGDPFCLFIFSQAKKKSHYGRALTSFIAFAILHVDICVWKGEIKILFWFYASSSHHSVYLFLSLSSSSLLRPIKTRDLFANSYASPGKKEMLK